MKERAVTIYLSGGIANLDYHQVHGWREVCKDHYRGFPIRLIDPTRNDYRSEENGISLALARQIAKRDKMDIMDSDITLAYCPRPSWGTAMEIIYAFEKGKWVVVVCDSPAPSPWLLAHADILVKTFEEAWHEIGGIIERWAIKHGNSKGNPQPVLHQPTVISATSTSSRPGSASSRPSRR